jgi:hypothetical protein
MWINELIPGTGAMPFLSVDHFRYGIRLQEVFGWEHVLVFPDEKDPSVDALAIPGDGSHIEEALFYPLAEDRRFEAEMVLQLPIHIPPLFILSQVRRDFLSVDGPLANTAFQTILIEPGILASGPTTADGAAITLFV